MTERGVMSGRRLVPLSPPALRGAPGDQNRATVHEQNLPTSVALLANMPAREGHILLEHFEQKEPYGDIRDVAKDGEYLEEPQVLVMQEVVANLQR